ncbi:MAG: RIP metalloprotease RseP [Verrucomicrobia bacterium RIFCSPHIGHO2_12_FULL_41_10]|nr:MAG: RIP metalloprotease RseP [Verrucomicrobia bacterium RIFCSPHIGHO2_12_FULL_41_10]HLB34859.1 RIP metalloprotease RseP [Chthoniobacterales bacterium]
MFSNILSIIGISLEVIILFNLLIVVHELGHFLAARSRGLVVEKFAIWFGKPIWSKTINGIEYRLGCIPAGGFVAIPQLAPMEALEGESKQKYSDLPPVSPLDKIIVAAAGPVFSLLLALAFACVVWGVGRPVSEAEKTAVIGYVMPDGPAAKAGLQPGDKILAVNAHPVTRINGMGRMSDSVSWNVATSQSPLIPIRFERDGVEHIVEIEPLVQPRQGWGRKNLRQIQILPAQTPMISKIIPQSPASAAGLLSGDLVVMANGVKLLSPIALAEILNNTKGQAVTLVISRRMGDALKTFSVNILPLIPVGEKQSRLGIVWDQRGVVTLSYPNPWDQIAASVSTMWETISAVMTPHSEITVQHLSGPVGIMRIYYMLFESPMGWRLALWFSVVLNVNLALLNLLPFPVLDGGHILLAICEWAIRKPIEHRVVEWIQSGFALILMGFMLYVTFFDLLDLPPLMRGKSNPQEKSAVMQFASPVGK